MADRERFELSVRLPVRRISSAVLSTAQPPVRVNKVKYLRAPQIATNEQLPPDCHRAILVHGNRRPLQLLQLPVASRDVTPNAAQNVLCTSMMLPGFSMSSSISGQSENDHRRDRSGLRFYAHKPNLIQNQKHLPQQ